MSQLNLTFHLTKAYVSSHSVCYFFFTTKPSSHSVAGSDWVSLLRVAIKENIPDQTERVISSLKCCRNSSDQRKFIVVWWKKTWGENVLNTIDNSLFHLFVSQFLTLFICMFYILQVSRMYMLWSSLVSVSSWLSSSVMASAVLVSISWLQLSPYSGPHLCRVSSMVCMEARSTLEWKGMWTTMHIWMCMQTHTEYAKYMSKVLSFLDS